MQNAPQGATTNTISLLLGHPDPTTLFTPEFAEAMQRFMASGQAYRALQYGVEQGNADLLDFLVGRISREQSIALRQDQLMIVAGSTQAVDLIARLYTEPGDVVIVEAPTYADALHIFRDHGVELHSVPMDAQGARVDELEQLLQRLHASGRAPKLFYSIPNFHNPSGITLTEARRVEIVRLAHEYGMMIVEDDVYRHLAFETVLPRSFFALSASLGLARDVPVMQIGSFSKTLAPGLRLGWLMAPSEAIARFAACGTSQMGGGASPLAAAIVAEYCGAGSWDAHVERLRTLYQMRRDTMLGALERYMPPGVSWTQPAGGFFIWLTLPEQVAGRAVKQQALERGVMVAAGEGYFINRADGGHNLRLTYSFAAPEAIDEAVRILAEVVK